MFMKKGLIFLIILLLLITPIPVHASAGGGSAGGSGGGGGGGSSGGHPTHHYYDSVERTPLENVIYISGHILLTLAFANLYAIQRLYRATKRHTQNVTILKHFENTDKIWNKRNLKKRVKEVFYATQQAWTNQDCEAFKPYLTESLYDNWCTKINWQIFNNTRNVLDHIHLLTISFIDVYDDEDDSQDYFCVYLQALMVDYMIDEYGEPNKSTKPGMLYEFWYFRRSGDTFYLDEIKQIDEKYL